MADLTKPDGSSYDKGRTIHKKRLPTKVKLICVLANFLKVTLHGRAEGSATLILVDVTRNLKKKNFCKFYFFPRLVGMPLPTTPSTVGNSAGQDCKRV